MKTKQKLSRAAGELPACKQAIIHPEVAKTFLRLWDEAMSYYGLSGSQRKLAIPDTIGCPPLTLFAGLAAGHSLSLKLAKTFTEEDKALLTIHDPDKQFLTNHLRAQLRLNVPKTVFTHLDTDRLTEDPINADLASDYLEPNPAALVLMADAQPIQSLHCPIFEDGINHGLKLQISPAETLTALIRPYLKRLTTAPITSYTLYLQSEPNDPFAALARHYTLRPRKEFSTHMRQNGAAHLFTSYKSLLRYEQILQATQQFSYFAKTAGYFETISLRGSLHTNMYRYAQHSEHIQSLLQNHLCHHLRRQLFEVATAHLHLHEEQPNSIPALYELLDPTTTHTPAALIMHIIDEVEKRCPATNTNFKHYAGPVALLGNHVYALHLSLESPPMPGGAVQHSLYHSWLETWPIQWLMHHMNDVALKNKNWVAYLSAPLIIVPLAPTQLTDLL